MNSLLERVNNFNKDVNNIEISQQASIRQKEKLEGEIKDYTTKMLKCSNDLDIVTNAITILREISDESVKESYRFIEDSLNASLEKIFRNGVNKVRITESTRAGQYPQLELELIVEGDVVCTLKEESGHGLTQVISLLCELSLIVIIGARRIMVMDEILSGLSGQARKAMDDIMWAFTKIGFQFIICEHGFIPKGAQVYQLKQVSRTSNIEDSYIEQEGVYIDGEKLERSDLKKVQYEERDAD